ncbi:nucleotide-binding universal stress UspA family protein [Winogradskyella wandonensis]|uniref:Nucleotide-binding universal stress UspA family protein n=1 Tax=Winogradskyella wandonensis TaxID=1442586 RepID=A0A4R1KJ55_9FLAO|nr:universal stress protein [Winogradskyella wandonensis]TCK64815.1 nucleotide-binding universal stress UspA family protein [Winogradskyella wandonensis]
MKRRILLPTDFSDNSWSAIVYALKLFKDEECIFYLLNSVALKASTISNFSNSLLKVMKENAMKELDALKKQIETADANANHEFYNVLSTQDLYDAIKFEIKQNNIDLIVMGTKGATGAKEIFLGSNTIKVIKKIKNCPVLIVPDEYDYIVPRQITFPTDFKRPFKDNELDTLKLVAELYDSKIRILHINEEEELSIEQKRNHDVLKERLRNLKLSFHWMPDYDSKEAEINEFIADLSIDLLVMVYYKRSLIERIMNEPVVKRIGLQPVIPFLVIPA